MRLVLALAAAMRWTLLLLFAACAVDRTEDAYWDDTHEDDGDALASSHRVTIDPGETSNAELIETLPVGNSESSATKRIVMRVAVPNLAPGDRLIVPAEAQVTTRCDVGQIAPGCDDNPTVRARLVLADHENDVDGKTIATQTQSCTKAEHHCMFVFRPGEASIDASSGKFVNLVMWAWGGGEKVLVGGNDGNYLDNGKVEGDQGRLMIVRERGITGDDRARRETTGGGSFDLNTNANPEVAYEHLLKAGDLEAGEQFVIEAKIAGDVASRARLSAELEVSKNEKIVPGAIGEHNGVNCLRGDACVLHKVAVFRVTEHIAGPVYVRVLVRSAVPGGGSTRVTIHRNDGYVRSVRYAAAFAP